MMKFKKLQVVFIAVLGFINIGFSQDKRPNILVIVADDLGYSTTNVYGKINQVKTPNIDRIAKEGAKFTDAYVTANVCGPSRSALLTGRYQQRFGIYANFDTQRGPGVPASEVTMGRYFKDAGYTTAAIGKWHIGVKLPGQHPLDRGFDKYYGFNSAQTDYFNSPILFDGKTKVKKHKYLTFQFTDEAIDFIDNAKKKDKEKPFFMYLAYNAVHGPNQAPEDYIKKFSKYSKGMSKQAAMVSALDDSVGRVLNYLKAQDLEENTLVYFLSDNGGLPSWWKGSNDPWRGFKREQWEGGTHVQFMMRWPAKIKAGQTREELVSSLDVLTTSLAAAGIKEPKNAHLDGVNILPVFKSDTKNEVNSTLFWAGSHLDVIQGNKGKKIKLPYKPDNAPPTWAVRSGDWKLVQMMEKKGKPLLFNLKNDPTESKDVADENENLVRKLTKEFNVWFKDMTPPIAWDNKYYEELKTIK
ncbi:sulfatase [Polaribacter sp. Q13]|uniref:sulfatase family protein n=1 Tax=Polaribacter sp. Q13 TaxID=2806551 RepID=UPI00193BA532|nr:sulfatase-like hydrolase/transferase [Polaribacter sp. Q13]QVY66084.1 sulfatase-like hydrolase/transferase [Polaribacter sp. Q13]